MKQGRDRIIFPLDVPTAREAMGLVEQLKDRVGVFKVGLELFTARGPAILQSIREVSRAGIFLDLKLHDIPATVRRALAAGARHQPQFITVHCDEGGGVYREVELGQAKILAITVLTSLNEEKLLALGQAPEYAANIPALVVQKARLALEAGCHGLVCSGQEVAALKKELGPHIIAVTPGIRPLWSLVPGDDQKRIVTPAQAIQNGADYIVVGRPIRDAKDPGEAADKVALEIQSAL